MSNSEVAPVAADGPAATSSKRLITLCGIIYVVALGAYAGASGRRITRPSNDNHYVHLAYGWLHGRLDLGHEPPHKNDWAEVTWVHLKDGRVEKGAYSSGSAEVFRTLKGKLLTIPAADVDKKETKYYVSFPPFPGLVMLPVVAIAGMRTNDVLLTVILAPLAPVILLILLWRLRQRGDSTRSQADDLWLTFVFGVGTVYYFSCVRGEVWYTAHVTSVIAVALYALFSLDARRPMLAGLALACGFLSRPEILFAAPLFLWEMGRVHAAPAGDAPPPRTWLGRAVDWWHRLDKRAATRALIAFGIPLVILGCAAGTLNLLRFGRFTEFGHTWLNVIQAAQIKKYGLFNLVYLARNLSCAFALTPVFVAGPPYIRISYHGLAMWVTTPVLLYLLWPRVRGPLHRPLWLATACMAIPNFFYQNSGWVQFGYRFSLDYMILLVVLLAIGGRRLTWTFKLLALLGFALNLFGAINFGYGQQFYFDGYFPPDIK